MCGSPLHTWGTPQKYIGKSGKIVKIGVKNGANILIDSKVSDRFYSLLNLPNVKSTDKNTDIIAILARYDLIKKKENMVEMVVLNRGVLQCKN